MPHLNVGMMAASGANPIIGVSGNANATVFGAGTASAGVTVNANGTFTGIASPSGFATSDDWHSLPSSGVGDDFQIAGSVIASNGQGSFTGPAGYVSLSSARQYFVSMSSVGSATRTVQFQIRRTGTTLVLATTTYGMTANREVGG